MSMSPMTVTFSPGTGFGIVAWPTVALIESADPAVAERLWTGLVGGGDGNDLIDELSADGFRNLGSFVVAQIEGPDIRLFVRGRATVGRYGVARRVGREQRDEHVAGCEHIGHGRERRERQHGEVRDLLLRSLLAEPVGGDTFADHDHVGVRCGGERPQASAGGR